MSDTTYNGWPNYQTWNVMLWLDNDEGAYNYYVQRARNLKNNDERLTGYRARLIAEDALGCETGDGVNLSNKRIKWASIAEAMRESA